MCDNKFIICKKCGNISDEEELDECNSKCFWCGNSNSYAVLDLTEDQAREKYSDIIKEKYGSEFNSFPFPLSKFIYYRDEMIRKDYFYGILDTEVDRSSCLSRQDTYEKYISGELSKECREIEKKRNNATSTGPKCPSCGSTSLKKITAPSKVFKVKMFGIFGVGDLGKKYHCKNCGIKF